MTVQIGKSNPIKGYQYVIFVAVLSAYIFTKHQHFHYRNIDTFMACHNGKNYHCIPAGLLVLIATTVYSPFLALFYLIYVKVWIWRERSMETGVKVRAGNTPEYENIRE